MCSKRKNANRIIVLHDSLRTFAFHDIGLSAELRVSMFLFYFQNLIKIAEIEFEDCSTMIVSNAITRETLTAIDASLASQLVQRHSNGNNYVIFLNLSSDIIERAVTALSSHNTACYGTLPLREPVATTGRRTCTYRYVLDLVDSTLYFIRYR